jgi:4-hydroxy-tetrahydrodipicolinate synthase
MNEAYRPERLLVPLVTPFDAGGRVDEGALASHGQALLAAGAAGLVALATTGEASSLDDDERALIVRICARVCAEHDAVLVVGAGTNDTRTTIARHEALAEVPGVKASLAVVPYYVRPSEEGILRHFHAVAACSPVPLIVYNIPYRTGRGLGSAALLELADSENVVGVKQAVGGIDTDTLQLLAAAPPSFSVLGGDDAFLFPLVLMGGRGAIAASANVATSLFEAMIDDGLAGNVVAGRARAEALLRLVVALFAEPSPAVIKGVLHAQGQIPTPSVRLPLADASPQSVAAALNILDRLAAGVGGAA